MQIEPSIFYQLRDFVEMAVAKKPLALISRVDLMSWNIREHSDYWENGTGKKECS